MPFIEIQIMKGRTIEEKRALVTGVTKAVCDAIKVTPEKVRIVISDIALEDYGVSGGLAIDYNK